MKRDMELVRKILFEIEDKYVSKMLMGLQIEGYDQVTVAYHCKIMYEAGLISEYKSHYANDEIYIFFVGSLSWEGNDYLDKIRDNSIWNKTKATIKERGLPLMIETIKTISTAFITAAAEGATNAILKNGNQ